MIVLAVLTYTVHVLGASATGVHPIQLLNTEPAFGAAVSVTVV